MGCQKGSVRRRRPPAVEGPQAWSLWALFAYWGKPVPASPKFHGIITSAMVDAANHSAIEQLRNGLRLEIRALRPDDRADLLAAIDRTSAGSLFRRFFAAKRGFTEQEIAFFLNPDFVNHVALVAVVEEDGRSAIVGGGRYIVVQPGTAEVAFAVVDQYQGQGIRLSANAPRCRRCPCSPPR